MSENIVLVYELHDFGELNLSYMPFITNGGMFVPSEKEFSLGDKVLVDLHLPVNDEVIVIYGRVVWRTPKNALHHVMAGVGIQFEGGTALEVRKLIESYLDKKVEVGGYTYGMSGDNFS